jgi:hypothetical protein
MNHLSQWPENPVGGSTPEDPNSHTFDTLIRPDLPAETVIDNWADTIEQKFVNAPSQDDKMEILMQQEFIHLNLIDIEDEWADFRRTRHPKLEPFTWEGVMMKPVPERIQYPTSELSGNEENYLKVAAQNNNTSPIFWVPSSALKVVPYWNDYNYK